jgi:DNA-binding GntR family transcriptional regulator
MKFTRKKMKIKLADKIAQALRYEILSGMLLPGERIIELQIANEFGISNGPLREALYRLESEGFVSTPANGRTTVNEITEQFIDNYLDISCYFLLSSAKKIIENCKRGEDCSLLYKDLVESCNSLQESLETNNDKGINESDDAFTTAIIMGAGNVVIQNMWGVMDGIRRGLYHVTEVYYKTLFREKKKDILENFKKILDCMINNDENKLETFINNHYKYRRIACMYFIRERNKQKREEINKAEAG